MLLFAIRHGQTDWNAERRLQGQKDVDINDIGRTQARGNGAPDDNDWARVGDRWYVSFPPGPALLILPGVALLGFRFDDVAFTAAFAALNVLLLFLVMERLRVAGDSARR